MIVSGQVNVASSLPAQQYNNSFVVVCSRRRRRLPFGVKERESVDHESGEGRNGGLLQGWASFIQLHTRITSHHAPFVLDLCVKMSMWTCLVGIDDFLAGD